MNTWFLLFDGSSPDGRGFSHYVGRTQDKKVARQHFDRCESSPYCTGGVRFATDSNYGVIDAVTDWEAL